MTTRPVVRRYRAGQVPDFAQSEGMCSVLYACTAVLLVRSDLIVSIITIIIQFQIYFSTYAINQ